MKRGILGTLIFGLIFAPIGYFVAFYFGKPILDDARASTKWPSVEGVVERSEVATSRDSDNKTMYSADVVYRYSVGDKEFRGSTVSFGGGFSSSSSRHAYAVTKRYPVGRQVPVYYQPEVPANAVLAPGVTWSSFLVFGIGLLFLVVGVLMLAGPACYIAIGTLVVAGAATGAIGRRKVTPEIDPTVRPADAVPARRSAASPKRDSEDDGFDIG